ncbi:hypothetical protein HAX54_052432 [Datura stramonium]|uniref:Uncharacterized protein n=1 Tax=Datura stramonium TaxID=4076 RepID=A0ABS8RRP0_DATST|nr:hypothetical protein [Datura stramonium]
MESSYDMLESLKDMFGEHNRATKQTTMKALLNTKMAEVSSVRDHVLRNLKKRTSFSIDGINQKMKLLLVVQLLLQTVLMSLKSLDPLKAKTMSQRRMGKDLLKMKPIGRRNILVSKEKIKGNTFPQRNSPRLQILFLQSVWLNFAQLLLISNFRLLNETNIMAKSENNKNSIVFVMPQH